MVVDDPFTIVDFFSNSTNYIEQLPRRPSPGGDVFVTSQVRNNNNNNTRRLDAPHTGGEETFGFSSQAHNNNNNNTHNTQ